MEKNKTVVWLYVKDTKTDDYDEVETFVFDTQEKARAALKHDRDETIDYWNKPGMVIGDDTPDCFSAWEDGEYAYNHDTFSVRRCYVE